MNFTIDRHKPHDSRLPGCIIRAMAILDNLPLGELITSRTLAAKLDLSLVHIRLTGVLIPDKYWAKKGSSKLYGHPKTVAAWKKTVIV